MNDPTTDARQGRTATRSSPGKASMVPVLILVLLVLLPVGFRSFRGEFDRWRAARTMEAWLDGDRQQSITTLREITGRLPEDHRLKLVLGEWLLDERQAQEALETINEIPEQYRDEAHHSLERQCLLALGKPAEALAAYRDLNPPNAQRDARQEFIHRSSLAYYQALAGEELVLALHNSEEVLGRVTQSWIEEHYIPFSEPMQALFCSAVVYRHQMQRFRLDAEKHQMYADRAEIDLSGAIDHLEQEYARLCDQHQVLTRQPERTLVWYYPLAQSGMDQQVHRKKEEVAHALASCLTLRALIYQDLGKDELSFADRRRAVKLGYQPEEVAEMLPAFTQCFFHLELVTSLLDTRGCVLYQLDEIPAALADLNFAVAGQAALVEVSDIRPRNLMQTSLDPRQQYQQFEQQPRKSWARMLFHRSWARRAAGDNLGANRDLTRIRELGYIPGNYLN